VPGKLARLQRSAELADDAATPKYHHTYLAARLYPGKIGERLKDAEYQLFRISCSEMADIPGVAVRDFAGVF
jgi:hypothetical protein